MEFILGIRNYNENPAFSFRSESCKESIRRCLYEASKGLIESLGGYHISIPDKAIEHQIKNSREKSHRWRVWLLEKMGSSLDMGHFLVKTTRLAQRMVFEFKVSHDDVIQNRKKYRNIAIHLTKKFASMNSRQTRGFFGNLSYSATAKAYQRFSAKLKRDKFLLKAVEEITESLS